jgi:nucleoside-diphosphate-sugar epimerase
VLRLGNTDIARDFSDVLYVCDAYHRLLDAKNLDHRVFNICSGVATSLESILKSMEKISGYSPVIEAAPELVRKDDIKSLCGSNERLFKSVGNISIIPLRDTLLRMYQQRSAYEHVIDCG